MWLITFGFKCFKAHGPKKVKVGRWLHLRPRTLDQKKCA